MGCFHSVPVDYQGEPYVPGEKAQGDGTKFLNPGIEQALSHARAMQISQGRPSASGFSLTVPASASVTGRTSHNRKSSHIGADLHAIMDDQGMLNPLVSRQLSVLSHYSVRSESGSVMITPEDGGAPFKLLRLIGRGGFGNVYLGEWEKQRVAIKVIQGNTNSEQPEEQEWEARKERMAQMEAILMSAINHETVVRTFKVTSHSGDNVDPELAALEKQLVRGSGVEDTNEGLPSFEWHIIMEYCDRGSLSKALATFRLHEPADAQTCKWDAWSSIETLKEVTRALMFLHENRILHGDLKAANVLLASKQGTDRRGYVAKVSDFGLSRVLQENKNHIKTQTFGTVTHMPPELLSRGTLSPSADVYAVGVLMWEIYTAEKVFKQLSDSEVILAVVTKKARPTFPPDVPTRFKFLAERCWAEIPEMRPSLEQLMAELENLQHQLCPHGEATPPMLVKVYPTRAKALAELFQKMQGPNPPASPASHMPSAYSAYHAAAGHGGTAQNGPHVPPAGKPGHAMTRDVGHRPSPSRLGTGANQRKSNGGLLPGQLEHLQVQTRTVSYSPNNAAGGGPSDASSPGLGPVRNHSFGGSAAATQPAAAVATGGLEGRTGQQAHSTTQITTGPAVSGLSSPRGPSPLGSLPAIATSAGIGGAATSSSNVVPNGSPSRLHRKSTADSPAAPLGINCEAPAPVAGSRMMG